MNLYIKLYHGKYIVSMIWKKKDAESNLVQQNYNIFLSWGRKRRWFSKIFKIISINIRLYCLICILNYLYYNIISKLDSREKKTKKYHIAKNVEKIWHEAKTNSRNVWLVYTLCLLFYRNIHFQIFSLAFNPLISEHQHL